MCRHGWRIDPHAAEFGHFKNAITFPHALRPEKNWARRGQAYQNGNADYWTPKNYYSNTAKNNVKGSFHLI
jgi:hypothetical protein